MKYYHVIYNSSQKGLKGSVGFGIRTITEGTPKEYLDLLTQQEIFAFKYSNSASLTPAALFKEVNRIEEVPVTYFYTTINISSSERLHVLGRKIAVGFDYTYYLNYQPGRLGNYIVDCFIFNEQPSKDIFELLYETPKPGCNYFLPRTPVPSPENEDMKYLSLGHIPYMEVEEKDFKVSTLPALSIDCTEILFAYIEAQIKQKPLFIKAPAKATASLIADFYRLLPNDIASQITFVSNYQEDGIKQGYQIFFINEYFPFEIYKNQYIYINLIDKEFVQSKERDIFKGQIVENIRTENWNNIYNKVKWILSEEFRQVRELSAETNTEFYNYCIEPESFNYNSLIHNKELQTLMAGHFQRNPKAQERINTYAQHLFAQSNTITEIYRNPIRYIQSIAEIRFNSVIDANKEKVTAMALTSVETVKELLSLTSLEGIKGFLNLNRFFEKEAYLSSLRDKWETLYPYFIQDPQRNLLEFIRRTYKDELESNVRERIITKVEPNPNVVLDLHISLLKERDNPHERMLLDQVKKIIQNPQVSSKNMLGEFKEYRPSPLYAPLFYWQIKQYSNFTNPLVLLEELADLMEENAIFKQLITKGFDQDRIYAKCFENIKSQLASKKLGKEKVSECIGGKVLDIFRENLPEKTLNNWVILSDILANAHDELDNKEKVREAFNIALEIREDKYAKDILPKILLIRYNDDKVIKSLINKIIERRLCTPDSLFKAVKAAPERDVYWQALFKLQDSEDVVRMLAQLEGNGLNEKEQEIFMLKYFPKGYGRYQKSMEPSFFYKLIDFFSKSEKEKTNNTSKKEKK